MSASQRGSRPSSTAALPPIVTDGTVKRSQKRLPTDAKQRLSSYSMASRTSHGASRPVSLVFPVYNSSLPYAVVRDFAYPTAHPLHYGPQPSSPRPSSPASEDRSLSDSQSAWWENLQPQWSAGPWTSTEPSTGTQQLPAMTFGDGPPYSEDEDLHSPIVTSRHHRRRKSAPVDSRGRSPGDSGRHGSRSDDGDRGVLISLNGDGSETYYVKDDDNVTDDGPGGEFVTYPANEGRYSHYISGGGSRGDATINRSSTPDGGVLDSDDEGFDHDRSRYSRDYQFSIASPDEEMHGKAVALFDFTREHENELPLREGQVILVSYRHGQGWLVAEDPRTGESGLVPEAFVRLVRDIEGGLTSLNGDFNTGGTEGSNAFLNPLSLTPEQVTTPTQAEHSKTSSITPLSPSTTTGSINEKHPSIISTFSTSSRDLDPYPLGEGQGRPNASSNQEGEERIEST